MSLQDTGHDNPYDVLAEDHDTGQRWAFGTGFTDPLEGIDRSVPDGVDAGALARCCLALGDDALIYSHRLQQWITSMPELEEETAIANIALDLLGQARMLLARAGGILGKTEDQLAFFRTEQDFRNVRLVEHADRDFAELVGRLLIFATWRLALLRDLSSAADPVLAAIAAKGAIELTYHRDYAAQWVIRLGDGTSLSHARMQAALDALWPLTEELFRPDATALAGNTAAGNTAAGNAPSAVAPHAIDGNAPGAVAPSVIDTVIDTVLAAARLDRPPGAPRGAVGALTGRDGVHTEAMGYILAELQSVARAYPDATW